MNDIIYNAIRTPDGTVIVSEHRHDFRTHEDANGRLYSVDGGLDYLRRLYDAPADYEELSIHDTAPHHVQREYIRWGTRGSSGKEPYEIVLLKDMSNAHIQACLDTQQHMTSSYRKAFTKELEERELGVYPNVEDS